MPFTEGLGDHCIEPEWREAFNAADMVGLVGWVVNEDFVLVDATPDLAEMLELELSDILGKDLGEELVYASNRKPDDIQEYRKKIAEEGGVHVNNYMMELPKTGWSEVLIVSIKIVHPTLDRWWILNIGWNATEMGFSMMWMRDQIAQKLMVVIADHRERCLLATQAASEFCGFQDPKDMVSINILDTEFAPLAEREKEQIEKSRETETPSFAMEWLLDHKDDSHLLAVSRVGFQEGGSLMIFHPLPITSQYFMYTPVVMIKRATGIHITNPLFDCLVDMYRHMRVGDSAAKRGIESGVMSNRRGEVAKKFKSTAHDLLADIASKPEWAELDRIMRNYAMAPEPERTHTVDNQDIEPKDIT